MKTGSRVATSENNDDANDFVTSGLNGYYLEDINSTQSKLLINIKKSFH